jgi:outer membrane protein assembly factor BamB
LRANTSRKPFNIGLWTALTGREKNHTADEHGSENEIAKIATIAEIAKIDFSGRMFMDSSVIFVGIRGSVHCLDRRTGQGVWSASLKGSDYVTLLLDGDLLLAATRGEVFCLQAATGSILWNNNLPGQGLGLASMPRRQGLPILRQRRSVARTKLLRRGQQRLDSSSQ